MDRNGGDRAARVGRRWERQTISGRRGKEDGATDYRNKITWTTSSLPRTKIRFPLSVEVWRGLDWFTCKDPKEG